MAILQEEAVEMSSQTFDKSIDEYALQMMMDILQKKQYLYPQKSAVRELTSNAIDAIKERDVARSILSGESTVQDHYMDRTEGVFRDSVFVPEYYDLNWLSTLNEVHIMYHNNGNAERDELVIRDYGVGLWGKRLRGYFNIGYSTKRNSRFALGKFGVGAKSALATGVAFFTVVTRYNGKKTAFNVYNGNVEPITPRFNLETGVEHEYFEMEMHKDQPLRKIYYEPTEEFNGLDIILQVKKHHKTQYLDAVKSQLMYFSEVKFYEILADGQKIFHETLADILYEDEVMVISNNSFHNKPHLLIDKVNYGNINFQELEMNDLQGNIGVKLTADEVSVNPSRESVIWDDMTKESISRAFNRVLEQATKRIERELQDTDLIKWYRACAATILGYRGTDPVLHAMSRLVDFNRAVPKFSVDKRISYSLPISKLFSAEIVTVEEKHKGNKKSLKLSRERVAYLNEMFQSRPLVMRTRSVNNGRKNKYLSRVIYPQGYIDLVKPDLLEERIEGDYRKKYAYSLTRYDQEEFIQAITGLVLEERYLMSKAQRKKLEENKQYVKDHLAEIMDEVDNIITYLIDTFDTHPDTIQYDKVVVPDDFRATETEEEEDEMDSGSTEDQKALQQYSEEERRKLEGTFLIHAPSIDRENMHNAWQAASEYLVTYKDGTQKTVKSDFFITRLEMRPSAIDNWECEEIYYGTKVDQELTAMATILSNPRIEYRRNAYDSEGTREVEKVFKDFKYGGSSLTVRGYGYNVNYLQMIANPETRLVQISMDNVKYFTDYKHIRQFFMDMDGSTLTMSMQLRHWNTGRIISPLLDAMTFLRGFNINPALRNWYTDLEAFCAERYTKSIIADRYGVRDEFLKDLTDYLERATTFQEFVADNNDPEQVAVMAKALLNPKEGVSVTDARVADLETVNKVRMIHDMCAPIRILLNQVPDLKMGNGISDLELEQEIRAYIVERGAEALLTIEP